MPTDPSTGPLPYDVEDDDHDAATAPLRLPLHYDNHEDNE